VNSDRFRPTRAGVINVWDYVDEEFAFADGRLALRGHNGSGKTKALEVLFPFVLDGVADSRRLDPFSGENRTMKSNLLYRGQEAEYGYVWMEFARVGQSRADAQETVTLIIGMRAHRNRDGVTTWFFVTGKRLGVDFGLLSADSRPLTERQLKAVLEPGCWYRTATEYRDAVDARLFGLGRERYAQLLDLLLALRRPLLAKDLDPAKVSDTLTSGLSPVDDDLVQQAARDFENLAAVQKLFDDLAAANTAVQEFLAHYTAYLRSHVRFALDRVQARIEVAAVQADRIATAARAHRQSVTAEQRATAERDAKASEGEGLQGRLAGLKNSEEYKAQGRLEDKRREVASGQREVGQQRARLGRDKRQIEDAEESAARLSRRAVDAKAAEARFAAELAEAAQRSGIADDGFGPVDTGEDLLVTARARVVARRDDVGEIRRLLEAIRDAKSRRSYAEQEAGRKETAERRQQQTCEAAAQELARAHEAITAELAAWTSRWAGQLRARDQVLQVRDATALTEAIEHVGEAGAPSLAEVFAGLTAERQHATITARANLDTDLRAAAKHLADLKAEREAIAAEKDDAPQPNDLRPANRAGRPGAPLWRLVRFADGVDADLAAAIEGALYGAGLLTAWVHPDPALTRAAIAAAEADGYLMATEPVAGPSLADILVAEQQDQVPADVITKVLRSIALSADLAGPMVSPAQARPAAAATVSTKAQFSYGPHAGARPKIAPEFVGATNREIRRHARLAEKDQLIALATDEERRLSEELERAQALLDDFKRARRGLPSTAPVARAAEAVSTQAALLARARDELINAQKAHDAAIAEVDSKNRSLRQAAAQRRMPTEAEQIDAISRAAAEFESAATQLHGERAKLVQVTEDLADQHRKVEQLNVEYGEAEHALAEREREQHALQEEFRALSETLGADVTQVLAEIRQTEQLIKAAVEAYRRLSEQAQIASRNAVRAEENLKSGREALAQAVAELHAQAGEFGQYARAELWPLIGVTSTGPWPDAALWPDADRACDALTATLTGEHDASGEDAATTVTEHVFPVGIAGILAAFADATRGGRQVTEGTLKNSADRMSTGLKDFTDALAACDQDFRVDWEAGGVITVHVIDDEGRKPVAEFAARIGDRQAEQGILLEEGERKVLEDELLAGLARQIHGRVIAARDLVREMDADTRSKPMSSGIAIGIRWAQSDRITDAQRTAARLVERAPGGQERLTELRGVLREMIREYRGGHPRATYREALASVLDYRTWHVFELLLRVPRQPEARLTRAKHSVMSGGEKSASIHLPLFAAANALYSSAKEHCPRMIALDEAFVGIDERYKPDLFGLAVKFDLDLFMTGHDLWVRYDTVPMIAHYDMYHDKNSHAVSSLLIVWDGTQLIDAAVGYADNDDLASQLLGFRPTRHAPLSAEQTLYAAAAGDPNEEDDEEEESSLANVGGP
jgi:uncharacterized protein (TIGR02680 family)